MPTTQRVNEMYRETRFELNGYRYIAQLWNNGALRVFHDNGSGDGVETFSLRVINHARSLFN